MEPMYQSGAAADAGQGLLIVLATLHTNPIKIMLIRPERMQVLAPQITTSDACQSVI